MHTKRSIQGRRKEDELPLAFYIFLWSLVFLTLALCFAKINGIVEQTWRIYYAAYLILALLYTWFTFTLLFWGDLRPRRYGQYRGEKISVIIPCYNEPYSLIRQSLLSVINAE